MIDILLASYQGKNFISEQLDSIFKQTYSDIKLIIRDDASTDGTKDIIEEKIAEYETGCHEKKFDISMLNGSIHLGSASESFMRLLGASFSEYVMFSDQDDVWDEQKAELTFGRMQQMEKQYGKEIPLLVYTDLEVTDANGNELHPSFVRLQGLLGMDKLNNLLIQNAVTGCTMMLNRKAADLLKRAHPSDMLMHDHFAAVMTAATGHIEFIDKPLVKYRQHKDNAVGASGLKKGSEIKKRIGDGKTVFQHDMLRSYEQAEKIVKYYQKEIVAAGGNERLKMLIDYSELAFASAADKRKVFSKYNIYKNGFLKKEVQKLWC